MTSLRELEQAATSDFGPLRLPLEVKEESGTVWMGDGDRFYAETCPELTAAALNALPALLDVVDAARWLILSLAPTQEDPFPEPWQRLDTALAILDRSAQ